MGSRLSEAFSASRRREEQPAELGVPMSVMNFIESMFRWFHLVAGIAWIGHLYFLNWVNSQFEPTLDAETKRKVIPELRPRVFYWFRWGAAITWVTGVLLLMMVYYHGGQLLEPGNSWGIGTTLMIIVTFAAVFLYDFLTGVIKDAQMQFWAGIVAAGVFVLLADFVGGFSYKGYAIHLGTMFGSTMAFNVWFRIWPNQRKIITAIKSGQAPDPAMVAVAGGRSKHNTYMSVPLMFMMLSQHAPWAANPLLLTLVVAVGFFGTYHLYNHSTKVKGF